jgi:hypothetical protein
MSYRKIIFFLFISLSLIFCQSKNKTEEVIDKKENKAQPEIKDIKLNATNNTSSHRTSKKANEGPALNISMDEMDTIMLCSAIVQENLKTKTNDIEKCSKRLNLSNSNQVYEKVGTDIFQKCLKNIDIKTVNKFIKNMTYYNNFQWEKSFDNYTDIDYDKYGSVSDLRLTMEQQIMMYKYNKVSEKFRQKRADEREKIEKENKKIRIGKIDMDSIPTSFKLGIFLVILFLFFGGIFYFLKNLVKKPTDKKKKKEKKKKTQ